MSKTVRKLLALNIVLVAIWGTCKIYFAHKAADVMPPKIRAAAASLEKYGSFQQSEMERHMNILHRIDQSHDISDDDLDWGVYLIQASSSKIDEGVLARCTVLSEWRSVKQWTPSQHEKVFHTVTSLLQNKDGSVRSLAMQVIVTIKDPRSVSCLLPLLDSYDPAIKKEARQTLVKLGYKS